MDYDFKKTSSYTAASAIGSDTQIESRLSSESFDVKLFVKDVSSQLDSSREWFQHKKRMQGVADRTAHQLKQNVFKNYTLFIDSSKEISSLESEMYQLSQFLHEQQALARNLQAFSIVNTKGSVQEMESPEKQEQLSISFLLETVEGSSIVTEVHERYLVHSGQLYELDQQQTHKDFYDVRAFLLNDSLMTALRITKRRGPVKFKFQALYELENMAIVDVKDTDTMKFCFKILMFPDSHFYQAESEEEKRQWIRKLEATKSKHKEEVDAAKRDALKRLRNQSIGSTGGRSLYMNLEPVVVSAEQKQADMLMEDWIKEVPENLDVYIAQREFDQAVELIMKTKAFIKGFTDTHAVRDVRIRLNHRVNFLSDILMKELETSPSGSLRGGPRAARRAVGLLIKLGRSAEACNLFLENYRQIIQRDMKDVKMEKTVILYATNLASTFFTGLRNAATEFERAFDENYGSYSSFIVWCNDILKIFAKKYADIIFSMDEGGYPLSTITDCIFNTMKGCESLNDIGLDLSFALWDLFHPYLAEALDNGRKCIREECAISGTAETWAPLDLKKDQAKLTAIILQMESLGMQQFSNLVHNGIVDLSNTTINFCRMTVDFMNDVFCIYTPQLLEDFIGCFCDIFNNMIELYTDALGRDENISMSESIMNDAVFIIQTLLPTFISKMNSVTGVAIPDLVELHDSLQDAFDKKSREASAEPSPSSANTRPAEPYHHHSDNGSDPDSPRDSELDFTHSVDNNEDDEDDEDDDDMA